MTRHAINPSVLADPSWLHWAATIPLLVAHLIAGQSWALPLAACLCIAATLYFYTITRHWKPYPVQVRLAYLLLLLIGTIPWLGGVHWIQLLGTTGMVSVGYCPLIRLLSLVPHNRRGIRLTRQRVFQAIVRDPCSGGLIQFPDPGNSNPIGSCAIPTACYPSCAIPSRNHELRSTDTTEVVLGRQISG